MIVRVETTVPATPTEIAMLISYAQSGHEVECEPHCPFSDVLRRLKKWIIRCHPEVFELPITTDDKPEERN